MAAGAGRTLSSAVLTSFDATEENVAARVVFFQLDFFPLDEESRRHIALFHKALSQWQSPLPLPPPAFHASLSAPQKQRTDPELGFGFVWCNGGVSFVALRYYCIACRGQED
ncbi:hypothetical protein U9M48_027350 [Paspalum notatum var. saurae]|uniref:Uncharacterized protein n=1 Tax=Paspalum notatum var. saurae TaxID=547442 RepID=A0AAQ3TU82_PASNO